MRALSWEMPWRWRYALYDARRWLRLKGLWLSRPLADGVWWRTRYEEQTRQVSALQKECAELRDQLRGRKLIPPMEIKR